MRDALRDVRQLQVQPAREVSGDLYDFFALPDGRLAFFLGDVSGKGMPAALTAVSLCGQPTIASAERPRTSPIAAST